MNHINGKLHAISLTHLKKQTNVFTSSIGDNKTRSSCDLESALDPDTDTKGLEVLQSQIRNGPLDQNNPEGVQTCEARIRSGQYPDLRCRTQPTLGSDAGDGASKSMPLSLNVAFQS